MLDNRNDKRALERAHPRAASATGAHADGLTSARLPSTLARALCRGEARAVLSFGGQGVAWLDDLRELAGEAATEPLIAVAEDVVGEVLATREVAWSDLYARGFDLRRWLEGDAPDADYLASTPVSMPAIFLTQIARTKSLVRRGLGGVFEVGAVAGLTGYSQGLHAAALVAESPLVTPERFGEYLRALTWLAFDVTRATRDACERADEGGHEREGTPMALVVGPSREALERVAAGVGGVALALVNDRKRHVLSGTPGALARVRAALVAQAEREAEAHKRGRHAGVVTRVGWEWVATSAAFHSPLVADGLARTLARCRGLAVAPRLPVFDPACDGARLEQTPDPTAALLTSIALTQGRWQAMWRALEARAALEARDGGEGTRDEVVLDLGPGDGIANLTAAVLRGSGVEVAALGADVERREAFFSAPRGARAQVRYADFAPSLAELGDGTVVVDNAFSRATGTPPVILPGMTPTTVDVPIVAAAANAGFTAELAGGGQVSPAIFAERMRELQEALAPGVEVAFNALLLDAYLWGMQLGERRLVQKARAAGAPLSGVTVSAGIPPLEDAVRLVEELGALGMRTIAFKPGTRAQIEEVVAIARAVAPRTLFVHVEGGKAGGHHSWEDLDALLLETYHLIRAQPNLVLCVGGGIADEARAVELVLGRWSLRHGEPAMPVDAVFLGTLAMACREASATAAVKAALAATEGTAAAPERERWVLRGDVRGGVTSGRSQLDADIHYLDNAAARCGRLLDEVAGDAAAVAARREEIIAALAATAKPYFGDVDTMSSLEIVRRMFALTAIGGACPRYEDGPWLDVTWRERAYDLVRRVEARLAGRRLRDGEAVPEASVAPDRAALDRPEAVLAALAERYPEAAAVRLHPADALWFVRELCARPGKPVPFVPIIDRDVRRWYKADSLWQAQHPRYGADEVLVIPGPEAVSGIRRDEPVAALLGRFARALVEALAASGVRPRRVESLSGSWPEAPAGGPALGPAVGPTRAPAGCTMQVGADGVTLQVDDAEAAHGWRGWIGANFRGPLAELVAREAAEGLATADKRRVDNPVARLLAPVRGGRLTLRAFGERLTHVRYEPNAAPRDGGGGADRSEWVTLEPVQEEDAAAPSVVLRAGWGGAERALYKLRIGIVPGARSRFVVAAGAEREAAAALYARTLFATPTAAVAPFQRAHGAVPIEAEALAAYRRLVGQRRAAGEPLTSQVFSLAWPALFATLSCEELGGDLLRLVHLDNAVTRREAFERLAAAREVEVTAQVTRIEDAADHRRVTCEAEVTVAGVAAAHLRARFHIRGAFEPGTRAHETLAAALTLDAAGATFLAEHAWLTVSGALTGRVMVRAELGETRVGTTGRCTARGEIVRDGARVATLALDVHAAGPHPVHAALAALQAATARERTTPRRTLARATTQAPTSMRSFAAVGGDHNPLHTSLAAARLAGLDGPIVHGMWTAARLEAFLVDACGPRVRDFTVTFTAPVVPGETLSLTATRVAVALDGRGDTIVEATAKVRRGDDELTVASARATLGPPASAYVFPGQGIQQRDMGMAALLRSAAARAVWERADRFTREALGFSILRVVRDNPPALEALGTAHDLTSRERLVHPQGVLHLTQLTQVAMAVLASAQVAELREAGVWDPGAALAGHSVGEYNALSSCSDEVMPLEAVIAIVYQRGRVMHGLVPRDARGESGYAMGVIRPGLARLDHAGAERIVAEVARVTGGFLQIVNYNVRGRQYAVTGDKVALGALAGALAARQRPGDKAAWVEVPGIDVPFHSARLRGGVADFRRAIDRHLPATIVHERIVGRYVPNLLARPFELTRDFVTALQGHVDDATRASLAELLARWDERMADPAGVARELLIELLAWQFASPVRWIETQDLLFGARRDGGFGVERLIEVGVGYQPTLANMARQTLAGTTGVAVMNIEAERARVFEEDADPLADAADAAVVAPASAPGAKASAAASERASVPAPTTNMPPAPGTSAARPVDRALTHAEALTTILALQAKVRPDQIGASETIDGLFAGVSSRRNQALMDIGAELDAGAIDGAHETPLGALASAIAVRAPAYRAPGAYLSVAHGDALKRVFGRSQLNLREHLDATWGFGPGLATATVDLITLETRAGDSTRGGALGALGDAVPGNKDEARALVDRAVALLGARRGTTFLRMGETAAQAGVVDAQALDALTERVFGAEGALLDAARALARACGRDLDASPAAAEPTVDGGDALARELGPDFAALVRPRFDRRRHIALTSSWATAQRDLVKLAFDAANGRVAPPDVLAGLARLAPHAGSPRLVASARWLATRPAMPPWLRAALSEFAAAPTPPARFSGQTALVSGASPDSIAIHVVHELLAGGARVVVTTTSLGRERAAFYRRVFEAHAAPGAELHVVPCNQASFQDLDQLVDWLFGDGLAPDLLVPFAAIKDSGTLDQLGPHAEASLRAMVLGTERLVGLVGRRLIAAGGTRRCHVLLPLSPNHGAFGGDGAYAEGKAALEVMLAKHTSEAQAWGKRTTLVGARIGWVRGTGLMAGNDAVAPGLEAATGLRTWSAAEMGRALAELLSGETRARALERPLIVDLSGGFDAVPDLKAAVDGVRNDLVARARFDKALATLRAAEAQAPAAPHPEPLRPLPAWPAPNAAAPAACDWPAPVTCALEDMVVIVGFGELGPGGSARTRAAFEMHERLGPEVVVELAWATGLVRFEPSARGGAWRDVESGDVVAEHDLAERYHDRVRARLGIRPIEPATVGFDAASMPVYDSVYLARDASFVVGSADEARAFVAGAPEHTSFSRDPADPERWRVTRKAGAEIRVQRQARLSRRVAGQIPTGSSLARYGFTGDMLAGVDPLALMNLAATVDAFVAAGTTPEELFASVHPTRVATTQGSGMGGMKSLQRLFADPMLGRERQRDILQETLINVVFAHTTSGYLGSYGAMSHPVAACATAALSLEDALDKIKLGKADVVLAGGFDDLSAEGVVGFGDMNATAETDTMEALGLEPDQMSRPNDRRRKGFVEAHGGGALLLARGDVAAKMGLPVYGVLGYAGSFGDGIHRSIPAPGIGALGAAIGGRSSPLSRALEKLGLDADDIALVSKHDTSTAANDPNESGIHQTLQEALGRTPGNPLLVVSQKSALGHAKGGAAAWQAIGLCQALAAGEVPGNRNLESVDAALERHDHLLYTNVPLRPGPAMPLRAGLATSLGFGHVSALLLLVHPAAFEHALDPDTRASWRARASERRAAAERAWAEILLGQRTLYEKRSERRFAAPDDSEAQRAEETAMLLDPGARFDPERGVFTRGAMADAGDVASVRR